LHHITAFPFKHFESWHDAKANSRKILRYLMRCTQCHPVYTGFHVH
jgi:hypothetical protein